MQVFLGAGLQPCRKWTVSDRSVREASCLFLEDVSEPLSQPTLNVCSLVLILHPCVARASVHAQSGTEGPRSSPQPVMSWR